MGGMVGDRRARLKARVVEKSEVAQGKNCGRPDSFRLSRAKKKSGQATHLSASALKLEPSIRFAALGRQ